MEPRHDSNVAGCLGVLLFTLVIWAGVGYLVWVVAKWLVGVLT